MAVYVLDEMGGWNAGGDDFARLLQDTLEGIHDNDAALFGVLVKMPMRLLVLVMAGDPVQQLLGQFAHLGREAADGDNQAALLAALVAGQDVRVKEVLAGRSAAVDDVRVAYVLLLQAVELVKGRGEDGELGVGPALALLDLGGHAGKLLEDLAGALGEAVVDDVDVADRATAHHEGHADVPVGLHAAAEDGNVADMVAAVEQAGGAEGGAEGREAAGVDDAGERAVR